LKGDQGSAGVKGDQGEQGEQGLKGDQGEQGLKGDQGSVGVKGEQGLKGDQGEQGPKGDTGTFDSSELNNHVQKNENILIDKLAEDSYITLVGTNPIDNTVNRIASRLYPDNHFWRMNLWGVGDKNDYGFFQYNLHTSTDPNRLIINPKNLTLTTKDNNNIIVEQNIDMRYKTIKNVGEPINDSDVVTKSYTDSLVLSGAQGPKGDTGAQGPQGDTGLQGPQGDTGLQGPKGDTGLQGPQGDTGIQGLKGDTGLQGPQGDTGIFDSDELINYYTKSQIDDKNYANAVDLGLFESAFQSAFTISNSTITLNKVLDGNNTLITNAKTLSPVHQLHLVNKSYVDTINTTVNDRLVVLELDIPRQIASNQRFSSEIGVLESQADEFNSRINLNYGLTNDINSELTNDINLLKAEISALKNHINANFTSISIFINDLKLVTGLTSTYLNSIWNILGGSIISVLFPPSNRPVFQELPPDISYAEIF